MKLVERTRTGSEFVTIWRGLGRDPDFVDRPTYPASEAGADLKRRREAEGISPERAADRLEMSVEHYTGLESGRFVPENEDDWFDVLSRFLIVV